MSFHTAWSGSWDLRGFGRGSTSPLTVWRNWWGLFGIHLGSSSPQALARAWENGWAKWALCDAPAMKRQTRRLLTPFGHLPFKTRRSLSDGGRAGACRRGWACGKDGSKLQMSVGDQAVTSATLSCSMIAPLVGRWPYEGSGAIGRHLDNLNTSGWLWKRKASISHSVAIH